MKYTSHNAKHKDEDFLSYPIREGDDGWCITDEMNLIVTDDFENCKVRFTLPKFIKLNDPRPGEPKYMRKRSRQVVRMHKINQTKHPHEYYYSELQLYSAFRKESELEPDNFDRCKLLHEQRSTHNNKLKIQNVKSVLMKYLEDVEEGTDKAKEMQETLWILLMSKTMQIVTRLV